MSEANDKYQAGVMGKILRERALREPQQRGPDRRALEHYSEQLELVRARERIEKLETVLKRVFDSRELGSGSELDCAIAYVLWASASVPLPSQAEQQREIIAAGQASSTTGQPETAPSTSAPAAPIVQAGIGGGKLMPREPSEAMLRGAFGNAFWDSGFHEGFIHHYQCMHDAAHAAPVEQATAINETDTDFGLTDEVLRNLLRRLAKGNSYYAALRTALAQVVRDYLNAAPQVSGYSASPTPGRSEPAVAAPPDGWTADPPDAGSLPVAKKEE